MPAVHAAPISPAQRAVVLRVAEITRAVGRGQAVIELRRRVPTLERRPRDGAVGRIARAGRADGPKGIDARALSVRKTPPSVATKSV